MTYLKILLSAGFLSFLSAATNCAVVTEAFLSDHFDGKLFFDNEQHHTLSDEIKWFWNMKKVKWPEWIEDPVQPRPPKKVNRGDLRITYINHATLLIQMDGVNILTDPIWSLRAGPFEWLGPKRVRAPGVAIKDLPQIDVILISHDHYDHLDLRTLKQLSESHKPAILAGLGVKKLLEAEGIKNVFELDWWQEHMALRANMKFTFVPAYHESGRGLFGKNRSLWGGFVIEGAKRVYFAGDTAYGKFLDTIREKFREFDLAIFPIGNYEKRWIMRTMHMNPDDAVRAHALLNVKQSAGMHFGTFLEHPEQTIDAHERDLLEALKKYNMPEFQFWILRFGEGRQVQ